MSFSRLQHRQGYINRFPSQLHPGDLYCCLLSMGITVNQISVRARFSNPLESHGERYALLTFASELDCARALDVVIRVGGWQLYVVDSLPNYPVAYREVIGNWDPWEHDCSDWSDDDDYLGDLRSQGWSVHHGYCRVSVWQNQPNVSSNCGHPGPNVSCTLLPNVSSRNLETYENKSIAGTQEDVEENEVVQVPADEDQRGRISGLDAMLRCRCCMKKMLEEIYQCSAGHLICRNCSQRITNCPVCREIYQQPLARNRFAEQIAQTS